ncbi:hypothetical protein [Phytoactinopolyspora limicola]|uniref:hypothetical protein n=1 Tax=Phytoactinopolyspora limicola TaxID=2715536 RepID=UPI00140755FF|nr:hypothetical protein [Phytoactinopolyspora limicola]
MMGALATAGVRGHRFTSSSGYGAFLVLHLRARGVMFSVIAVGVVALIAWAGANHLMSQPFSSGPDARIPVVMGAPLLAAIVVSFGLSGRDEWLERSTAFPWRRVRAVHATVMAVVAGAILALTGLRAAQTYGSFELVRNTVGFLGLVLVAAAVVGVGLAWLPVSAYAAVIYLAAPRDLGGHTVWWTWPLQPWSTSTAAWMAAMLVVVGVVAYSWCGARLTSDNSHT